MSRNVPVRAEPYALKNKLRRIWRQFVRVMACIVVFCTTYAMILPAITMQRKTVCGVTEHTHGILCYVQLTSKTVQELTCTYESLGVHVHTAECLDDMGAPVCGYADWLVHTHDDRCGDTCTLPEISEHTHSETCYNTHAHDEACYTAVPGGLLCEIHVHGDGCYDPGEPVCGLTEDAHTHADACYAPTLTCAAAEHTHGDGCYDNGDPICGVTEEGHVHESGCYAPTLTCAAAEHTHESGCYENGEPNCGLTEEAHVHGDTCYVPILLCGEEDHTHGDGCYEEALVLSCGLEEVAAEDAALTCGLEEVILHSHGDDCYDAETGELACGLMAVEAHSHTGPCFTSREIPLDDMETLTCDVTDENHLHIERCYGTWAMICGTEEHTHVESCYPAEQAFEYDCGLTEHAHGDGCYDAEGMLQCTLEPHSHAESGCQIAAEQAVAYVDYLIENIPSADEIEAKLAEFQAAGDDAGEEAWYTDISQQVARAYYYYSALTEEEKTLVTNADKLLELEYIWSVTTYRADYSTTIHWVDYYSYYEGWQVSRETSAVVFADKPVDDFGYYYWTGFVIERQGAHFRVTEILPYETNKTGRTPSATGYIVMIFSDVAYRTAVGDYVAFRNFYPDHHYGLSISGYGTVTFSENPMVSSQAPEVENYTSTSAFVNLNLYDYHGDINANGYTDINTRFLANNKDYPGFQWNGGAYPYRYRKDEGVSVPNPERDWIASRYYVDCLDFGNSYITDYGLDAYFTSTFDSLVGDGPWYRGYKTGGSVSVAKADASNGLINGIVYGEIYDVTSNTDHPIGVSTKYASIGKELAYDENGYYPQLGYAATPYGTSLRYLFDAAHPGHYAEKKNTQNIDGLFRQNPTTGEYYYDSRINHAQFNTATSNFVLYKQVITPNYILYPFGNFMPLNDITDPGGATQVSAFNYQGGVKSYFESVMSEIQNKANLTASEIQLYRMLLSYRYNWENWTNPKRSETRKWPDISATNTLNDYFDNSSEFGNDGVDFYNTNLQNLLTKVYNIDYNVPKNFFFGMDMSMSFMQPKDGLAGNDNNGDGTPDYPMVFYFAGDDDVWAFIDNILFLDLTGIHRHVGGEIDFRNGTVKYYAMDSYVNGAVQTTPYYTMTFAEILKNHGGVAEADLGKYLKKDSSGNYTTFLDYSAHKFNFYYMERGSGSSVCRINFNFPMLRQNTLSVEKELTADADIKALGNPDFSFQVLDVENGEKTDNSFFAKHDNVDEAGSQWAYSLYDTDGSVIQEIKVTEKNPNGSVHTLEVYNGTGDLLRRETQDANGDVIITDYPENGTVLTVDEHGVFKLKAGQRAEFTGISENWGEYFVRELIDPAIVAQYGEITVSGSASSRVNGVTVNDQTFTGIDSPIQDASNGSTSFRFNNRITSANLGELAITKTLAPVYSGDTDKTFRFRVTLNGAPLPAGTKYTVGSAEKTVVIEDGFSYVELKKDETAVISNILAGTRFEVVEVLASTDDYIVGYTVGGVSQEGSASGVIGVDQTVAVNVTNSERGAAVEIPVTKGYYYYGTVDRVSHFNLVRVTNATGMETVGDPMKTTMTVSTTAVTNDALYTLNYLEKDLDFGDGDTLVYYYRLTEDNTILPGSTLPNYQVFVYEVTLTKTTDNVSAEITGMWSGTADVDGAPIEGTLTKQDSVTTATFMNTIYGPLTVGKLVDGSDGYKQREFEFQIILNTTYRGGAPLPDTLPAVITRVTADGTETENTTVTLSLTEENIQTRKSITVKLSHNETITINQIPYQTTWSVTEVNLPSNVEVSYVIYKGGTVVDSVSAGKPVGYILVGGDNVAKVVFTNKEIYALPETGGPGTNSYAMVGLMLMLCSAAFLLYRFKKRGREVT